MDGKAPPVCYISNTLTAYPVRITSRSPILAISLSDLSHLLIGEFISRIPSIRDRLFALALAILANRDGAVSSKPTFVLSL